MVEPVRSASVSQTPSPQQLPQSTWQVEQLSPSALSHRPFPHRQSARQVWSSSPEGMGDVPAAFFVRFFLNHGANDDCRSKTGLDPKHRACRLKRLF